MIFFAKKMLKRLIIFYLLMIIPLFISAKIVDPELCEKVVENKLKQLGKIDFSIVKRERIPIQNDLSIIVYHLKPIGFMVLSNDDRIYPVLAYSTTSDFKFDNKTATQFLKESVKKQINNINLIPQNIIDYNKSKWNELKYYSYGFRPEQWPPEGSTNTEGWILTRWNQSYPYNKFCPLDPVTNVRSYAGCPSIAISQIINYYKIIHGISFSDNDDYHQSFWGRDFWIDDDYEDRDFPSFPELNNYLHSLDNDYLYTFNENIGENEKAALIFATGVAATQVYSSEVSGVFYESQVSDSYDKFNYSNEIVLPGETFYQRIIDNIQNAMPVQLSVLTEDEDAGHQLIIDGYNTDDYYHLNFGWGGSSDGWYHIPDDIPYSLTVLSCAFVDINPPALPYGLIMGNITLNPLPDDFSNPIFLSAYSRVGLYNLEVQPYENSNSYVYAFSLPIGKYVLNASYSGYETIESQNVIVEENDILNLDFTLDKMFAPYNLIASYENDEVELTWEFNPSKEFHHFNIYRKTGYIFSLIDTTTDLTYIDNSDLSAVDTAFYYVTAKYAQNNESEPSDTVFVYINLDAESNELASIYHPIVYPNPFNPDTKIKFYAHKIGTADLEIYNLKGQLIKRKIKTISQKGYYSFDWNGKENSGKTVSSGIYLYKLKVDNKIFKGKLTLLK